jgi:hypothetical protein
MRRRSADSIMARVDQLSIQQQAGYMYASLSAATPKKALANEAGPYMNPFIETVSYCYTSSIFDSEPFT